MLGKQNAPVALQAKSIESSRRDSIGKLWKQEIGRIPSALNHVEIFRGLLICPDLSFMAVFCSI